MYLASVISHSFLYSSPYAQFSFCYLNVFCMFDPSLVPLVSKRELTLKPFSVPLLLVTGQRIEVDAILAELTLGLAILS